MKLIVGLGNPGEEYANTRHNIGFMILDNYLDSNTIWKSKFNGLYRDANINGEKVIFLKPQTFINLSGNCVIEFTNYYKIDTDDILIIQDDMDLKSMQVRVKYKSSSGGHNGIKSIISSLNTDSIPRLKVGINNGNKFDAIDFVLSKFSKEEMEEFNDKMSTFNKIINDFIKYDVEMCMRRYNGK